MRENKERHEAAYPSIRAEIENDTSEQASEMDMWLDFQATEDAVMLRVMEAISDNAVAVGQQEGELILSEFCFIPLREQTMRLRSGFLWEWLRRCKGKCLTRLKLP